MLLCPLLRWRRASHTLVKMSEPSSLHFKCTQVIYKPSLLMLSSNQPTPRGETSSGCSLKHWKNRRLTWSGTSEGKSLFTTNRTLSRLLLLLLAQLPWRHQQHLTYNKCQVSDSCTQCQCMHSLVQQQQQKSC